MSPRSPEGASPRNLKGRIELGVSVPDVPADRGAASRLPSVELPAFQTSRWLRNGHLQTLAGLMWGRPPKLETATSRHWIDLPDGDRLALHDNSPAGWRPEDRAVLLVHGLGGCHRSPYLVRLTRRLNARGVRVFRLDLRGCGAGFNHARRPYHAGRSEDLQATIDTIVRLTDGPIGLAGFSLGGSIVLRWLGEAASAGRGLIARAVTVNPPVDLSASTEAIAVAARGLYDRYFARSLYRHVRAGTQWDPDSPLARRGRIPDRLIEFDDLFTAPLCGFGTAQNYYRQASAAAVVPQIEVPTLILTAADDPLIPVRTLQALNRPPAVQLHVAAGGGHLGYLARRTSDPDRRWMDWRVVEWLSSSES